MRDDSSCILCDYMFVYVCICLCQFSYLPVAYISMYIAITLSTHLPLSLFVYSPYINLSIYIHSYIYQYIYLYIDISIYLPIYLSICLLYLRQRFVSNLDWDQSVRLVNSAHNITLQFNITLQYLYWTIKYNITLQYLYWTIQYNITLQYLYWTIQYNITLQ